MQDWYSSFYPFYVVCKSLGIAPFCCSSQNGGLEFRVSNYATVYGVIIVILTSTASIVAIIQYNTTSSSVVEIILDIGAFSIDAVLVAVAIIGSRINARNTLHYLSALQNIDAKLVELQFEPMHKSIRSKAIIQLLFIVPSIIIGSFITLFLIFVLSEKGSSLATILSNIVYILGKVIYYVYAIQFVNFILLLKARYNLINKYLSDCVENRHVDVKLNGIIYKLKDVHFFLCVLTRKVNSMFSVMLLLFVASCFINWTTQANFFIHDMFNLYKNIAFNKNILIFDFYVLPLNAAVLIFLTTMTTCTSNEANRTAILVHDLFSHTSEMRVRNELRLFSLQLLHHKMSFTACGFFPVDVTLLTSIVASVSMYQVILIQFQSAVYKTY